MAHDLPTTVEWNDGTTRDYQGYDIEATGGILLLTRPESRCIIIPLECVRQVAAAGTVLVST